MKSGNATWAAYEIPLNLAKGVHFIEVDGPGGYTIIKEDVSKYLDEGCTSIEKRRFTTGELGPMRWRALNKKGKYLYGGETWPP